MPEQEWTRERIAELMRRAVFELDIAAQLTRLDETRDETDAVVRIEAVRIAVDAFLARAGCRRSALIRSPSR